MRAVVFHRHGGLEQLRVETLPVPIPAPDEALVRVRAVALNGFDPMVLRGIPGLRTPLPMIPCADCAGEIIAVGDTVDPASWQVGQRVGVVPLRPGAGMVGETLPGVACEFISVPQTALLPLPDAVTHVQAACLPTAYGTAMRMTATRARIARGERVLILGAAGGVGMACVQLCRLAGAEVIAGTHTAAAIPRLRALGTDEIIHTATQDFMAEVHRRFGKPSIWGGGGVDVVIDVLGGETWARSLACLGRRGRLVTCGASAGFEVTTDLRYVWSFEIDIIGSNGWSVSDQERLLAMVADGRLDPVVHAVRPLESYPDALRELMDGQVIGKSVMEP
ncbi:MAG: zinc-binding alcohol dehydrogenase family protein [Acetobacteraceae bacterium]